MTNENLNHCGFFSDTDGISKVSLDNLRVGVGQV